MLPNPTGLEEGKLLDLQLLELQDSLDGTAAPSQPQQLSSSIVPWWSMELTLSNPWAVPTFWAALKNKFLKKNNFHFFLYNLELAGTRKNLDQISEVRRSCWALLSAAAPFPASSQSSPAAQLDDLLPILSHHMKPGRCLSISLEKKKKIKMTEPRAWAGDEECFSFL